MTAAAARPGGGDVAVDLAQWRYAAAGLLGAAAVLPALPVGGPPCPLLALTGVPCPLCGMTTSVVAAARFDLPAAVAATPAGVVLLAIAAVVVVASLLPRVGRPGPEGSRVVRLPVGRRTARVVAVATVMTMWTWQLARAAA